jgi:hypothetical protein
MWIFIFIFCAMFLYMYCLVLLGAWVWQFLTGPIQPGRPEAEDEWMDRQW